MTYGCFSSTENQVKKHNNKKKQQQQKTKQTKKQQQQWARIVDHFIMNWAWFWRHETSADAIMFFATRPRQKFTCIAKRCYAKHCSQK